MLALVWAAYASFGLVASSVAPLVSLITADLGISYGQMGTILGAWQLAYIGVAYAAGTVIDRVGLRRALGVGIFVMAASALARGLAGDFWSMFLAVALFGLGGPMISIGAPKTIATWFQGPERATAAGIYTTGPAIGSIVVLSTANSLLLPATGSWRGAIAAYGSVVLVVGVLWWLLSRDPPREERAADALSADPRRLLRVRTVWLVLAIGFASFLSGHSLGNWLPKILEWHGFDRVQAGYWASLPNAIGLVGALTLPRLVPAGFRTRATALMFGASALSLLAVAAFDGLPLLGALVLQGFVRSTITTFLMLVLMEDPAVGAAAMGAAGGLYFTVGEIGGFAGPSLMGVLFDLTGGFVVGLGFLAALMMAMAGACLLLPRGSSGERSA